MPSLSLESCASSPTASATGASRMSRSSCTYRSPNCSLGSTWVFSLNSFQLMRPSTSGDDATAAAYSSRNVAPSRRSTARVPPTIRASNPGANGATQRPPRECTRSAISRRRCPKPS